MVNKHQLGMTFGTIGALSTLVWSIVVAMGGGKMVASMKLNLLFLTNPFTVSTFNVMTMIELVVGSFIGLYIWGWITAGIWNMYE